MVHVGTNSIKGKQGNIDCHDCHDMYRDTYVFNTAAGMHQRAAKLSQVSAAELSGMLDIRSLRVFPVGTVLVYSQLRYIKARAGDNGEDSRLPVVLLSTHDEKTNAITTEVFLSGYVLPEVKKNLQGATVYRKKKTSEKGNKC